MATSWQEFVWESFDAPWPAPEIVGRRPRPHDPVDDQWGRSESLDPDDVGDIADEGHGHRG